MEKDLPVVRLTLGHSLPEVRRKSTPALPLDRDLLELTDLYAVTEPAVLEYTREGREVRFPPGKFLALTFSRRRVTTITNSPHLESLPLEPALSLAAELIRQVDRAGWVRAQDAMTFAPERIRRELADPAMPDRYQANLAEWRGGGDRISVQIKRHRTAAKARDKARIFRRDTADAADAFIVSVELDARDLRRKLTGLPPLPDRQE